jgi:hypothetical protein
MNTPDTSFPSEIEFQTLSVCNSRCRVCPMEWTASTLPQGRMSDEMLSRLLDEIAEHRDVVTSVEPYLNNEPLLDKRFLDVLRRVREIVTCNIEVSTNAQRLSPAASAAIVNERLIDDLRFSVFGASREVHERVMVGLRWDRVRQNIAEFVRVWDAAGRPNRARVVFVENDVLHPEGEAERVRELWRPAGLDVIVWRHLNRVGNNRILIPLTRQAAPADTVVNCKMGYMQRRVAIMYDGDVLLCCQDWSRHVVIGTLRTQSLAEIWAGAARRMYQGQIYDPDVPASPGLMCMQCELATLQPARPAPVAALV